MTRDQVTNNLEHKKALVLCMCLASREGRVREADRLRTGLTGI